MGDPVDHCAVRHSGSGIAGTVEYEPVLEAYAKKHGGLTARNITSPDTLNLPFYDDFSDAVVVPVQDRWMDFYAYVNLDMPVAPPSFGVATFDGLNQYGRAYNIVNSNSHGVADYLTSAPIDLNYLPSDSVHLSFYYQATGLGNRPEEEDSLVLEFNSPVDTLNWIHVWSTPGGLNDTVFRAVHVPIVDTIFLKRGFQFRFKNYATLSGNLDHWHVDYILLDEGRSRNDTAIDDICISDRPGSILKDYYTVPWTHFSSLNDPYRDKQHRLFPESGRGGPECEFWLSTLPGWSECLQLEYTLQKFRSLLF